MEDFGLWVRSEVQVRLQRPHKCRNSALYAALNHTQDLLLQQN